MILEKHLQQESKRNELLKIHITNNTSCTKVMQQNTQVPRYMLFYEGGIFGAHALKAHTQYRDNVVNVALKFI